MSVKAAPPFQHRPYRGPSQPFTVGLRPISEDCWLEPDPFLSAHLAEKERLFKKDLPAVFRAEEETAATQNEVLFLITENLRRFHGATHAFQADTVRIRASGQGISTSDTPALLTASRLVQEDLVIMRPGPDGYRLAAASLCFPSSWRLSEKFGLSMTGIHEGVPGFNGSRMGQVVAKLFENLRSGQFLCRFNWSIYPDSNLHHPLPERIPFQVNDQTFARLFLRVERQTLRRLPESGEIMFTIKIHHDPLSLLTDQEDRVAIAAGLKEQILTLDSEQLAYKGLVEARDALADILQRMSQ